MLLVKARNFELKAGLTLPMFNVTLKARSFRFHIYKLQNNEHKFTKTNFKIGRVWSTQTTRHWRSRGFFIKKKPVKQQAETQEIREHRVYTKAVHQILLHHPHRQSWMSQNPFLEVQWSHLSFLLWVKKHRCWRFRYNRWSWVLARWLWLELTRCLLRLPFSAKEKKKSEWENWEFRVFFCKLEKEETSFDLDFALELVGPVMLWSEGVSDCGWLILISFFLSAADLINGHNNLINSFLLFVISIFILYMQKGKLILILNFIITMTKPIILHRLWKRFQVLFLSQFKNISLFGKNYVWFSELKKMVIRQIQCFENSSRHWTRRFIGSLDHWVNRRWTAN